MYTGSPTRMLFETDIDQASAGVSEGYFDIAGSLGALLIDEVTRPLRMVTLGAPTDRGPRARGAVIEPVVDSVQAIDGATAVIGVFIINPVYGSSRPAVGKAGNLEQITGWRIEKIGSLACTAGTATALKSLYGSGQSGSYRVFDTLVYTPTALGTALAGAYTPAPSVYSPADNTQGRLLIPEAAGAYGIILDPVAAGDGVNAAVRVVS